jgi:hypothetical protein
MIKEDITESLNKYLFADEGANLFAIIDGASVPDLLPKLDEFQPECYCLFPGNLEPDMAEVAPYLVQLEPDTEFTNWILENGWGKHWGIFAVSHEDLRKMRQHFRSFIIVYDSNHKPMRFRYYDPRVLRLFLPTCTSGELEKVFGPVDCYMLEDEDPNLLLRFRVGSGGLTQEKLGFNHKDTKTQRMEK